MVPADPHVWSWLGRWFDERGLLAIYRGVFVYGVCRLISWTYWALNPNSGDTSGILNDDWTTVNTVKVAVTPEKRTLRKFDKGHDHLQVRPFAGLDVLLKGKDA